LKRQILLMNVFCVPLFALPQVVYQDLTNSGGAADTKTLKTVVWSYDVMKSDVTYESLPTKTITGMNPRVPSSREDCSTNKFFITSFKKFKSHE
jgi:hypothetical protein